jgi:calnexin
MMTWRAWPVLLLLTVAAVSVVVGDDDGGDDHLPKAGSAGVVDLFEPFDRKWERRWARSKDAKYTGNDELKLEPHSGTGDDDDDDADFALSLPVAARYYGLVSMLRRPVVLSERATTVIQYEVKFSQKLECGGAYLKLVSSNATLDPAQLVDTTPFSVMFGPDRCGPDNDRVHLILRHRSPVTGAYEEKHLKEPPQIKWDVDVSHLYTLVLDRDGGFEVRIDGKREKTGHLLDDLFAPPFNPPKEIDDPEDKKPADWVDEERIPDPKARKPDDWDETAPEFITDPDAKKPEKWDEAAPELIPDPAASKPADWDDESDGEWAAPTIPNPKCEEDGCGPWVAPQIRNPAYKGKWSAPMIANPAYKGQWKPRKIANPGYFYDAEPLKNIAPIGGVAIEVWTVTKGTMFDNILVTSDKDVAEKAAKAWKDKFEKEEKVRKAAEDAERKASGLPSLDEERGMLNKLADVANEGIEELVKFSKEHQSLTIGIATSVLAAIPLFMWFCCCRKPKPAKEEEQEEEEEEEQKEEEEEQKEDEEEEKDKGKKPLKESPAPAAAAPPKKASRKPKAPVDD